MSDMPELLPCPFCGGAMQWNIAGYFRHSDAFAVCVIGQQGFTDAAAWNRRADTALGAEAMKRAAEQLADYYRDVAGRNQDGDFYVGEEAALFGTGIANEIGGTIRALPSPSHDALLAEALRLDEVKALVEALKHAKANMPHPDQMIDDALAAWEAAND